MKPRSSTAEDAVAVQKACCVDLYLLLGMTTQQTLRTRVLSSLMGPQFCNTMKLSAISDLPAQLQVCCAKHADHGHASFKASSKFTPTVLAEHVGVAPGATTQTTETGDQDFLLVSRLWHSKHHSLIDRNTSFGCV